MKKTEKPTKLDAKSIIEIVTSVTSVVLSVVAIFISFSIASHQNAVALFEKKFEVYQIYKSLINNSSSARNTLEEKIWIDFGEFEDEASVDQECMYLYVAFLDFIGPSIETEDGLEPADIFLITVAEVNDYCVKLDSAKYIFDLTESERFQIDQLIEKFEFFTSGNHIFHTGVENLKENILSLLDKIEQLSFLSKMERELRI